MRTRHDVATRARAHRMQVRKRKKGARQEGRRRGREEESDGRSAAGPTFPSLGGWTVLLGMLWPKQQGCQSAKLLAPKK